MLNHTQETIVRTLETKMVDAKTLAGILGKGYTEFKVQTMVLNLARKGFVDRNKAAIILHGTEMIKFLGKPVSSRHITKVAK